MDTDDFWQIIDTVHDASGGDMDRKCELFRDRLSSLEPQELRDFMALFDSTDVSAYTWSLWGAAYVIRGGCSDDSFSDFRANLISHGRTTFESALDNPETLADVDLSDVDDLFYEGFQYVMMDVAEKALSESPERTVRLPSEPAGEEWDEDSVDLRYPKLAVKFLGDPGDGEPPAPKKPWWKFW